MKKWFLVMGIGLLMGCSNNDVYRIKEDTPIPIKTMKGDSYIFLDEIKHEPTTKYMIYNKGDKKVKILFKARKNDIEKVNIVIDGEKQEMESMGYEGKYEYFEIDLDKELEDTMSYHFDLQDKGFKYYYGKKSSYSESEVENFTYTIEESKRQIPDWSKGIEWYSIYIDRFRDGNKDNSPIYSEHGPSYYFRSLDRLSDGTLKSELIDSSKWQQNGTLEEFETTKWGADWNKVSYPEREAQETYFSNYIKNSRRYGGDLEGVISKLTYLEGLGVGGINLSPVFYSASGSKLDTIDFGHISPDYGITNAIAYKELNNSLSADKWTNSDLLYQKAIDEAHSKSIKVIQEINFEYVSKDFLPYQDVLKNKEKSKYKDWFIVSKTQNKAQDLNLDENTVKLNLDNKELQDYLIKKTSKWVKGHNTSGIDGYFVKNNVDSEEFLKRWKSALLEINSEFLVVGESTQVNQEYKGLEGFDILGSYSLGSLMQNIFRTPKESNMEDIKNKLKIYSMETPKWNFLESYDTDRFYSSLINPNREFDRLNDYGQDDYINIKPDLLDADAMKKLKLAVLIQLTIDSTPVIYYGSEKGMWGADAPESRKPMLWDDIVFSKETDSLKNYKGNQSKIANVFKTDIVKDEISYDVKADKSLEDWYKQISEFRTFDKDLFKNGDLEVLDITSNKFPVDGSLEDVLAYKRELDDRSAIIIINTSNKERQVQIPVEGNKDYTEFYTGERCEISDKELDINIKPYGHIVLYRKVNTEDK